MSGRRSPFGLLISLLISISFLLVVILAVCISWGSVRDRLLLEIASPYGVKAIQTDLSAVGWKPLAIELKTVSLVIEKDNADVDLFADSILLIKSETQLDWLDLTAWAVQVGKVDVTMKGEFVTAGESQNIDDTESFDFSNMLPESILGQIPLQRISVNQYQVDYQPNPETTWKIEGSVEANNQALIRSTFTIHHDDRVFDGAITIEPKTMSLLAGPKERPWVNLNARLEQVQKNLVAGGLLEFADVTELEDWIALVSESVAHQFLFDGTVKTAFSTTLPQRVVQQWIADSAARTIDGVIFNAHINADIEKASFKDMLKESNVIGSASIQVNGDNVAVNAINLSKAMINLNTEHASIKPVVKELVGEEGALTVELSGKASASGTVSSRDFQLTIAEVDMTAKEPGGMERVALSSNQLSGTFKSDVLDRLRGGAKFQATLVDKPQLSGVAKLALDKVDAAYIGRIETQLEDLTSLESEFEYAIESRKVDFKLSSKRASLATETFNQWTQEFSVPLALDLGDIAISMDGQLDLNNPQGISTIGSVLVEGWQGNIEKNHFSSLDSPFSFSGDLSNFTVSAEVTNGLFDIGIPITDIRYKLNLQGSALDGLYRLRIENLEGNLVGGTVRIPSIEWDSAKQTTQFHVVISDWQFSQMIELLERDDINVTGTLDGMLPIFIEKDGVLIKDGLLTARAPGGVIQYTPDSAVKSMLSDQQELKMAADILENFEYEKLDVTLNQDIEFNQYLALTLKGKNPEVYGGTPVNLNLNIEHNILPLMQSLTLPGKVQENWRNLDKLQ